jgi:hypothetical protein
MNAAIDFLDNLPGETTGIFRRAPYRHLTEFAATAIRVVVRAAQHTPCVAPALDEAPSFVARMLNRGLDFLIRMAEFHGSHASQIYALARQLSIDNHRMGDQNRFSCH